jgi:hypothetical protein
MVIDALSETGTTGLVPGVEELELKVAGMREAMLGATLGLAGIRLSHVDNASQQMDAVANLHWQHGHLVGLLAELHTSSTLESLTRSDFPPSVSISAARAVLTMTLESQIKTRSRFYTETLRVLEEDPHPSWQKLDWVAPLLTEGSGYNTNKVVEKWNGRHEVHSRLVLGLPEPLLTTNPHELALITYTEARNETRAQTLSEARALQDQLILS